MESRSIFWLLGLLMACSGEPTKRDPSSCGCTSGREFLGIYLRDILVVRTGADKMINVIITYNKTTFHKTLKLDYGEAANITISANGTCLPMLITSNASIAVISRDHQGNMASVLPTAALGTKYLVFFPTKKGNQFTVIPQNEQTVLTLFPPNSYPFGSRVKRQIPGLPIVTVGDAIRLNLDLEAVIATANAPVAVLDRYPCGSADCGDVYEQIRPSQCFGPSFFVKGIVLNNSTRTIALAAASNSGTMRITSENETMTKTVNAGQLVRIYNLPAVITSSSEFQVRLSIEGGPGNCSLLSTVPHTSQFCQQYKTFTNPNFATVLSITCETNTCAGITINGGSLPNITWVEFKNTSYSSGTCNLAPGSSSYTIEHPKIPFGLQVFAILNNKISNGVAVCMSGSCNATAPGTGGPPPP